MNQQELKLAPLLARRELWLLLSVAYVDPYHRQRFESLLDSAFRRRTLEAAQLLAEESPMIELGPGEVDPKSLSLANLFAALDADRGVVEATFRQLFGLTTTSPGCADCELEYEPNTDVTYRSQRLADVSGFYQAFGLQVSARAGERLDHITVQAEFLYLLLAKEAAALQAGNQEGAEVCRDARRKFFQEHVGWWLPLFSQTLSRVAPAGMYRQVAYLTAALSAAERLSLELPPFKQRTIPLPSEMGPPDACSECVGRKSGS